MQQYHHSLMGGVLKIREKNVRPIRLFTKIIKILFAKSKYFRNYTCAEFKVDT